MSSLKRSITIPNVAVNATIGFTMGLYLFTYLPGFIDRLRVASKTSPPPLELSPEAWSTLLLATLTGAIAVLEIPLGVFADVFGRRIATILSLLSRSVFFAIFLLTCSTALSSDDIIWASLAGVVSLAFFVTLRSGTFNAWLSDSLHAEGLGSDRLYTVLAHGKIAHWSTFILGTFTGLYLYATEQQGVAYGAAATISFACAIACARLMKENQQHQFLPLRNIVSRDFVVVVRRSLAIARKGFLRFNRTRSLWVTTICAVGIWSMIYVIDGYWILYFASIFPDQLSITPGSAPEISSGAGTLILVFASMTLVGSMLLSHLLKRLKIARQNDIAARLTALVFALFALPIVVVSASTLLTNSGHFELFVVLVMLHKIADGAVEPMLEGLENQYIPEGKQERATVLSISSMIRSGALACLFALGAFVLVAHDQGHEFFGKTWLAASITVLFCALLLCVILGRRSASSTGHPR